MICNLAGGFSNRPIRVSACELKASAMRREEHGMSGRIVPGGRSNVEKNSI